jgi:hypothetical protein
MIPKNEVNPRFHGLSLFLIVGEVQDSLPRLNDDSPREANSNLLRWQSVLIFCLVKDIKNLWNTSSFNNLSKITVGFVLIIYQMFIRKDCKPFQLEKT